MDKGKGIVIVNSVDYHGKLDQIVNDSSRFSAIDYNVNTDKIGECSRAPWIKKAETVNYYCRTYVKPLVEENFYYHLLPTGSQPGRLYGMAKNHKIGCPMRPVLSAINTPEYHLAKWLETQLKPLLHSDYAVASSSAFIGELELLRPSSSDLCVSFDIKSLFTNVPLGEVIDDIVKTVFPEGSPPLLFGDIKPASTEEKKKNTAKRITKTVFKNMLKICSESIFVYNDNVYKQHDGVAMGSPLAPLLAEWFVSKVETDILNSNIDCKPLFYRRYVDDVFALFKCEKDRDSFFTVLNKAHPNLQFTMEVSSGSLPFLDTEISINNESFETKVFRKPTNTGVLLNYNSMAPMKWKKSLIRCMLTRAVRVSSNLDSFRSELQTIRSDFARNSYPSHIVENTISEFLAKRQISEDAFERGSDVPRRTISDDIQEYYIRIPYVGKPSYRLQRRIQACLGTAKIHIKTAFGTTKVAEYFTLKSKVSDLFAANVVYKFTCSSDSSITYLGETKRQLFRRISDHKGKDKNSAVLQHLEGCHQCQNSEVVKRFEIIQRCSAKTLCSTEALLISKHRPSLNVQLGPRKGTVVSLSIY